MPIRVAHLTPHIRSLKRRQKLRPDAPAWAALEGRWKGLVQVCRDTLKVHETGVPGVKWDVEAAGEIVKVAGQTAPEAVWQRAVAMFLLREADPRLFASEQSFRVQLGRLVRHLADTSRAAYWNPQQGRFQVVYRDPNHRAALLVGEMLAEAFGVAGVWIARQEKAEAEAKTAERDAFYEALRDVASVGAGP